MSGLSLLTTRAAMIALARPSTAYCNALHLDWRVIEAATGGVWRVPIETDGMWFDVMEDGVEAVVVEVFGDDAATTIDLCAWLPGQPRQWWRAVGGAPVLGMAHAVNQASYLAGAPLELYRTPEEWLRSDCHGAVLLEPAEGVEWLDGLDLTAAIAVRDDAHAREIDAVRRRLRLPRRHDLVVPEASTRVAA